MGCNQLFQSLSEYIIHLESQTSLEIKSADLFLPIGPAAEKHLGDAISCCYSHPDAIRSFTYPCVRRERKEDIAKGSHLSLFFLLMIVFGPDVGEELIDKTFLAITGIKDLSVKSILSHECQSFRFGDFDFLQKHIERAKNFPYVGYAYEMFDNIGIEVSNIAEFAKSINGKKVVVFAFGIERMIMHLEGKTNVWECAPFATSKLFNIQNTQCNNERRSVYLKHLISDATPPEFFKYMPSYI